MFFNYEVGDYLIHPKYGLGQFISLDYIVLNKTGCEFLKLKYLNDSYVFIPIYNIGILKFHSPKSANTAIEQLEKSKILRKQNRVKEELAKMASELMASLVARESKKVPVMFSNAVYDEFCASFPFGLTKSQVKAVKAIEADLSVEKPMDRLLCADVGFGKTEVAARAIALCITNNQKALFIVPTTILALQHYNVLHARYTKINKRCELLSKLSEKNFYEDWMLGKIDVLIATIHHKHVDSLLIPNLGLVVLDEEHHFGVKLKEKIREQVNFLQLSATPIPRTLHLALSNVKDISVLEDAPYKKQKTQVFMSCLSEINLKELILSEIERQGKVFIVVPRVQLLSEIEPLIDFADYVLLHGQLSKDEMHKAFNKFVNNEVPIVLATNIIESGMDIPDANLMLVFYACMFGVAQLHQLKGRVGRGEKESRIYFIVPKVLTDISKERLALLQENSQLGGNFNLSMQDMENRGAGTVVGTKQSGKDYGFGLEMYYDMLSQALGKQSKNRQTKSINWVNFGEAYISEEYIKDNRTRIVFYKKLSVVSTFEELEQILADLTEMGSLPKSVQNYLLMIRINILTQYFEVQQVNKCQDDTIEIILSSIQYEVLLLLSKHFNVQGNKLLNLTLDSLVQLEKILIAHSGQ